MKAPRRKSAAKKIATTEAKANGSKQLAEAAASATIASVAATEHFHKVLYPSLDLSDLALELRDIIKAVQSGDMVEMEAMLVGQAHALQTMFVSLMRRGNAQEYLKQYQTYMGLALKAQAQSRATIQALVELKYPRQVVITKQANIANGPQQVNNGVQADKPYAHEEKPIQSNELSGGSNELLPNTGTQAIACGVNQEVETVGAIHRAKN